MSSPREIFAEVVESFESRKAAASAFGCSYALIGHVVNGIRPVTKELAETVEKVTDGRVSKERALWGDGDQRANAKEAA